MSEKRTLFNISRDLARLSLSYTILSIQTAVVSILPFLTLSFLQLDLLTKYKNEEDSSVIISAEYNTILSVIVPLLVSMFLVVTLGYVFRDRLVSFLHNNMIIGKKNTFTMRQLHHVPEDTHPAVRLLNKQKNSTYPFFFPLPFIMLILSTIQILGFWLGYFGMEPLNSGATFYRAVDMFCTLGVFVVFLNNAKASVFLKAFHESEFPDTENMPDRK